MCMQIITLGTKSVLPVCTSVPLREEMEVLPSESFSWAWVWILILYSMLPTLFVLYVVWVCIFASWKSCESVSPVSWCLCLLVSVCCMRCICEWCLSVSTVTVPNKGIVCAATPGSTEVCAATPGSIMCVPPYLEALEVCATTPGSLWIFF